MSNSIYYNVLTEAVKAQGTIDRAQKRLNEAKSGVSHELFMAAQDTAAQDVDKFIAYCTEAEAQYKESRGKRAKVIIPKQWTQAKSNIKAALNFKMNLKEYATESAMRKALNEKRKEGNGGDLFANLRKMVKHANDLKLDSEALQAIRDAEAVLSTLLTEHAQVEANKRPEVTAKRDTTNVRSLTKKEQALNKVGATV